MGNGHHHWYSEYLENNGNVQGPCFDQTGQPITPTIDYGSSESFVTGH